MIHKFSRVHFKIVVFDLKMAYIGSANLTDAGIGMIVENTRNFEAGILNSNKDFVKNTAEQFDSVWMESFCKNCKRKAKAWQTTQLWPRVHGF